MKWIKTAIGAVIAISVLSTLVLSVINIKKSLEPKEEKITIGLNYYYLSTNDYIYNWNTDNTLNVMIDYLENGFTITNLYDNTNEINITISSFTENGYEIIMIDDNSIRYKISSNSYIYIDKTYASIYSVEPKNLTSIDITFTKPRNIKNINIITMLLSFTPIIFISGVLYYFYQRKKNFD